MKKDYAADDGSHSVPAVPDHDAKDIYGNRAYDKLNAGAKLQGFNSYEEIPSSKGDAQYQARLMTMKNDKIDTDDQGKLYHHYGIFQWESYYVREGQMAGDCVDLNTENPAVAEYIRNCYINYINMGVDGFRIDTMKHISRLTMNREFIPQFKEAGGDDFFMFGEGCVLRNEVWNAGMPGISVPFYTWNANSSKSDASYTWGKNAKDAAANLAMAKTHFDDNTAGVQLTSNNAFLNGNEYRTPDYSKASGLHMIDFYMHHKFKDAGSAFSVADEEDRYFNDATYNVTYVDSHDYGPNEGGYLYTRFSGGTQAWAGNFNLMFTFRGIPCVYYGSEVEFQKDMQIEPFTNGNKVPYARSGRAYFGDHLEGTVTATDFSEYTASGTVADTLNHELAQHVMRLNQIRRAVPALQKGQYSKDKCSGGVAFKRRFVDKEKGIDSFVLVAINGSATFSGVPNGTYVDLVTGDTKSGSTITTGSIGDGNMRVYVLQNETAKAYGATGKVGKDGAFLK
jgi:glycosidase